MSGPGEYLPDPTEGITDPKDLPQPKVVKRIRNFKRRPCPRCGKSCPKDRVVTRVLRDLGDWIVGRPCEIHLTYSQHHCTNCRRYFNADMSDLARPKAHYTHRVVSLAVRLVVEDGLPYQSASWHLWRDHRVFVPYATIQNWVEAGEKRRPVRSRQRIWTGPSATSLGTSLPMNFTTALSVSCRSSTIAPSSGSAIRSWITIRHTRTLRHSSGSSRRPWKRQP